MREYVNYFAYQTAAERYASGRPFFHPLAIARIRMRCGQSRFIRAIDVGCGTGQSTVALGDIAEEIVGVDSSPEMLSHAIAHPRIRYIQARAEKLPFADSSFDLMTVGLAFHWFDRQKFLGEARRLLRPDAWLVIYNNFFSGQMTGNDPYERWNRDHYLRRYPSPARNYEPPSEAEWREYSFASLNRERFSHEVKLTATQLVAYLLTQTNVIAAVEEGSETVPCVAEWLMDSVTPLFSKPEESFLFHCQIDFLRLLRLDHQNIDRPLA